MALKIDPRICPQNHRCPLLSICPQEAISQIGYDGLPVIDASKCTECEECVKQCALGAVHQD